MTIGKQNGHVTARPSDIQPVRPGRKLRIGILSPPFLPVPPPAYAGTERIVATLAFGLHERGHDVTVFAPGDSDVPFELVPTIPRSLWRSGYSGDSSGYLHASVAKAWSQADRFDLIHSHLDTWGLLMARHCGVPVVTTLHRRLDTGGAADLVDLFPEVPLVAISDSQRRWNPGANWVATIHHGLDFSDTPTSSTGGEYLLLVGRLAPEKGVAEAIQVARLSGRKLLIAAKCYDAAERRMFEDIVQPAIDEGIVDWRGEVEPAGRDELIAGALATLMLGAWPEPFGLVAIESMAVGTPVIARRAGAVTETIEHGSTGYLVDDVHEAALAVSRVSSLRRERISAYARGRFSAARMVSLYEGVYETVIARAAMATLPTPVATDGKGRGGANAASQSSFVAPLAAAKVHVEAPGQLAADPLDISETRQRKLS
jgi:glycosyltransferase involved in cell wall biosynthesis